MAERQQIRSARRAYESTLSIKQKELLKAVQSGDLNLITRLFGELSKTKRQDKWFDYVLSTTALEKKHKPVIKFLLKSGCRVKTKKKTKFLCTPLYYAVENNYTQIVRELIKKGASVHDKDLNDISPLEYAVQHDQLEIIRIVLHNRKCIQSHENLSPRNRSDIALFHMACYDGNEKAVREFLRSHFPIDSRSSFGKGEWKGFTPLHFSLSRSDNEMADILFRNGADIFAQDERGKTPIHLAFRRSDPANYYWPKYGDIIEKSLRISIKEGLRNLKDEHGLSYFHILCCSIFQAELEALGAIQFFLDNGVDINSSISLSDPDFSGYAALHFAARHLRHEITELLLENNADVASVDKGGMTPLHMVCNRMLPSFRSCRDDYILNLEPDRIKIAELLLDHRADVDVKDLRGSTPLHYAFSRVNPKKKHDGAVLDSLARLLLSKSRLNTNHTDSNGLTYLHIASSIDLAAVKTLVTNGASLNSLVNADGVFKPGYSALHFAIFYGKVEIVEYLLKNGVDPNMRINQDSQLTPLHLVCKYTYSETHHPNKSTTDDSHCAEQSHQKDKIRIIELLLKHGALINAKDSYGNTPLSTACVLPQWSDHNNWYARKKSIPAEILVEQQTMIQTLLCKGADARLCNNDHKSVLHVIAGQRENVDQMKILAELVLKNGVDVNVVNKKGLTPLHVALAMLTNRSLVQLFLEYGADVNAKASVLGTPLHVAAKNFTHIDKNHEEILLHLLDHPAIDLNAQDDFGNTPLHIAGNEFRSILANLAFAEFKADERFCVEILMHAGANINIFNSAGILPLHRLHEWLVDRSSRIDKYYSSFLTLIITHIKKLVKMNVFVSDEVRRNLDELSSLHPKHSMTIDKAVDEELKKLKSRLVDQYTSLHDILFKDANDMSKHVKNDRFKNLINSPVLDIRFPLFHGTLIQKFKTGSARCLILEPAKKALENGSQVSWPDSCSEHILKYLSNQDLKNLAELVSDENPRKRSCRNSSSLDKFRTKIPRSR